MSTFVELKSTWESQKKEYGIETLIAEKFSVLVQDETEDGVSSCFQLLLSFGNEGICEVLEEVEGQVLLREDMGIVHSHLWKQEIISFVGDDNIWNPLWEEGLFSAMMQQILLELSTTIWTDLSSDQQSIVLRESRRMKTIAAGTFLMGALPNDKDAKTDEKPRHKVTLSRDFLIARYPCTQALYESIMGINPSGFSGATRPVENISWCDAILFCNRLSASEGYTPVYELPPSFQNSNDDSKKVQWKTEANGYRLPTEAEWEYAAQGGQYTKYAGSDNLDDVAFYRNRVFEYSGYKTHPIGQKMPNGYGLYDMTGNVSEWVWDSWKRKYASPITDPVYTDQKSADRILRGGSWHDVQQSMRLSYRNWCYASIQLNRVGFRLVRTI